MNEQQESAFDAYVRLAEMHENAGNWEKAVVLWREASNEAPDIETQEHCIQFAIQISEFL